MRAFSMLCCASIVAAGCAVEVQLEGKRCSLERPCANGFACVEETCVDVDDLRPCRNDLGCAPGEECREGYCLRAAPHDAGRVPDGGDAGGDDAGAPPDDDGGPVALDAGSDAGIGGDAGVGGDAGIGVDADAGVDAGDAGASVDGGDELPDVYDPCPADPLDDVDGDGVCGDVDNCPQVYNPAQADVDGDDVGDECQRYAPPPCDARLTSGWLDDLANGGDGNGSDDFDELEAYLGTAVDADLDSSITICLADGVTITTTSAATGDRLDIPRDNVVLAGEEGGVAAIRNLRTDDLGNSGANWVAHSGVYIKDRGGLSLHNLTLSVAALEGRVVHTDYTGSANTLSALRISAVGFHSEGIHTRGPVASIVDVEISTTSDYGYGIEPQADGDIGSVRRVTIATQGRSAMGIGAFVNDGARISDLRGVVITTAGQDAHGITIGDISAIERMERVTVRRAASATASAHAIVVEDPPNESYFNTPFIKDNIVCSLPGGAGWTSQLADGSTAYTAPTNPFVDVGGGPFGAQTFPWGDESDAAANPGFNVQTQWGGACP